MQHFGCWALANVGMGQADVQKFAKEEGAMEVIQVGMQGDRGPGRSPCVCLTLIAVPKLKRKQYYSSVDIHTYTHKQRIGYIACIHIQTNSIPVRYILHMIRCAQKRARFCRPIPEATHSVALAIEHAACKCEISRKLSISSQLRCFFTFHKSATGDLIFTGGGGGEGWGAERNGSPTPRARHW